MKLFSADEQTTFYAEDGIRVYSTTATSKGEADSLGKRHELVAQLLAVDPSATPPQAVRYSPTSALIEKYESIERDYLLFLEGKRQALQAYYS